MRRVTIELGDVSVTARLLDEDAPVACQRLWDALPFEDRFTHSIWSGLLVHSNVHPKLDIDARSSPLIENPIAFLAAGDVVVWPRDGTLALAYGPTQFRSLGMPQVVTKVATLEGELEPFARAAYRMMFEGAKRLSIHPDGTSRPSAGTTLAGRLVEIEFGAGAWTAELLETEAPEYAAAVWDALPLEGPTSIGHSSGELLHFWCSIPVPPRAPTPSPKILPVEHQGRKIGVTSVAYDPHAMRGQHPGDLLWGSIWNGIRIIYGQAHYGVPDAKFGRIVRGDLALFAETCRHVIWEGSKPMRMRRGS